MARYSLNLPNQLKQEAEGWAARQGVSLNQFILWAVSEKVGALNQQLDDPGYPQVTYKRSASGRPVPMVRGTGIRVQTIATAATEWQLSPEEIAAEYDLHQSQVKEALAFYETHRREIDLAATIEQDLEAEAHGEDAPAP